MSFSVFGHAKSSKGWTMVKVNFSSFLPRRCDDDRDFEMWSPASHLKVCIYLLLDKSVAFPGHNHIFEPVY